MAENRKSAKNRCQICKRPGGKVELVVAGLVRPVVEGLIKKSFTEWDSNGFICLDDLNRYRNEYVRTLIEQEKGELSQLEKEVLESITQHEILSTQVDEIFESGLTFGQRLSDRMARFGGSWQFIIIFAGILFGWVTVNTTALLIKPFDPFPYIFLNLLLSCLAAIQAPIIMMSQNRQEAKDRLRVMHDYQVNLKAELEIRQLHQKLDHLLSNQWERLVEIQDIQMEVLTEMRS
ncbi:MAG: hypothetical protein AMK70_06065 [Nitrospira bacterium SG8_35_1]|nr:MAG: hypothetical protein AMK70_06065 [Nitrospira bacterium SG8_35_1]